MKQPAYEVSVSTYQFPDKRLVGFNAIEIIPPISRALAELVCEKASEYCDELQKEPSQTSALSTKITPYGFCDEGATVSTLLKFNASPTYANGYVGFEYQKTKLAETLGKLISPSGAAISRTDLRARMPTRRLSIPDMQKE